MTNMTNSMTNMHDMTNMSNIHNMQIPFAYAPSPLEYEPPCFNITNMSNMQINMQTMNPPYLHMQIYIYEKNAEYYIFTPGLPAAVRPGVKKKI